MSPQQKATAEAVSFVAKFNTVILYPTIALLTALAFFLFLLGCLQYLLNAGSSAGREKGMKNITYGIIGLVVMISAFTILKIAAATFGLDDQVTCANDPTLPGCENAFKLPPPPAQNPINTNNGGG